MKNKIIYILAFFALMGCSLTQRDQKSTLILNINNESRYTSPSTVIAKYEVSFFGPATSDNFTTVANVGDSLKFENLSVGDWKIVVAAYNASNEQVGVSSLERVTLEYNKSHSLNITIMPIIGRGSVDLKINVPATVTNPVIEATLRPLGATPYGISFTPNADKTMFSYISTYDGSDNTTGLQDGYYTLSVKLEDADFNNDLRGGFSEVIRVLSGVTTTGNFNIEAESINQWSFVSGNLTDNTIRPFDLAITGDLQVEYGQSTTLTATAPNGETGLSYKWYMNGEIYGSMVSYVNTDPNLPPGQYLFTCIAEGDKIASSQHFVFEVMDTTLPMASVPYIYEIGSVGPDDSISLSWFPAYDNVTSKDNLEYRVTYSTDGNPLNEVDLLSPSWQKGVYSVEDFVPLSHPSTYYYRVYVRDEALNVSEYVHDSIVYVSSTSGDDLLNNGLSESKPVKTLKKALNVATKYNSREVRLEIGDYTIDEPIIIDKQFSILGGYSTGFASQNNTVYGDPSLMTSIAVNHTTAIDGVSASIYYTHQTINNMDKVSILQNIHLTANSNNTVNAPLNTVIYVSESSPTINSCYITGDLNSSSTDNELITVVGSASSPKIKSSNLKGLKNATKLINLKNASSNLFTENQVIIQSCNLDLSIPGGTLSILPVEYINIENSLVYLSGNNFDSLDYHNFEVKYINIGVTNKNITIENNKFYIRNINTISINEQTTSSDPYKVNFNTFYDVLRGVNPVVYRDENIKDITQVEFNSPEIDNGGALLNLTTESNTYVDDAADPTM